MTSVVYSNAGRGTWLCPSNVTSVKVQCWGAGGGPADSVASGGGGGGGGEYAEEPAVAVTPGRLYAFAVGDDGTAGLNGGQTRFRGDTLLVLAHGGHAGSGTSGGAGATGSVNTTANPGGGGGNGATAGGGGGGGGSGGTGSAGNAGGNASGSTGGAGATAVSGGAAGGAGGSYFAAGSSGSAPGGGAGGAGAFSSVAQSGGTGQLTLTYTVSAEPALPVFIAGYSPVPGDMDNQIQAPFSFLASKALFRAELTTATTWTLNSSTLVPFNSILEDPLSGWSSSTHSWTPPAGYTGSYEVTLTLSCATVANSSTTLVPQVALNGTITWDVAAAQAGTSIPIFTSGSVVTELYGGIDAISAYAQFNSAGTSNGAADATAGMRCEMSIAWVAS